MTHKLARSLGALLIGSALATAGMAPPAFAHHSFAVFDTSKTVVITGVVKDYQYTNPHCWIDVLVTGPGGTVTAWGFEGGPPSMMRMMGWHYSTLKAGDKITVTSHPHRDGQNIGSIMRLVLPNGDVMGRRPVAGPSPAGAPAPGGN